jgi:hypothetical protein
MMGLLNFHTVLHKVETDLTFVCGKCHLTWWQLIMLYWILDILDEISVLIWVN